MDELTLHISDLRKTYPGGVQALGGVGLEIPAGLFGLLGPNGAGKSTLMKILATLLDADAGTACLNGVDLLRQRAAARRMLGYLPQNFGLYPSFTAEQMLDYLGRLKGIHNRAERQAQVGALLERVNLSAERRRKLGTFSGGMRQRFGIAQALLGRPVLLIVDEPTAGLDPAERVRFHDLLGEIAAEMVVILSTHIVADVARLCERFAVIRRGEILTAGATAEALKRVEGRVWEAMLTREAAAEYHTRCTVISAQQIAGGVCLRVLTEDGKPGEQFAPVTASLEDYYFSLINLRREER